MASPGSRTLLVHEYISGGGLAGQDLPACLAAEGRAMRRALAEDFAALPGVEVVMTLDARFPVEPGPWRLVRVEPGEERAIFERLASEVDGVALIAPETGGSLGERAAWIERVGGRSLGSSPAAIALTGDKRALGELWQGLGVPTPTGRRVRPAEGLPRDFPYPSVLKPIDGAGAVATFLVESAEDLSQAMIEELPEALLQPMAAGVPLSAAFLVTGMADSRLSSAAMVGVGRQWVEVHEGRLAYRGGLVPDRSAIPWPVLGRALRAVPGLAGWVGLDFLWDEPSETLTLLEINPRLTTSYVGWRRLFPRGDLARRWLLALESPNAPPSGPAPLAADLPERASVSFLADGSIGSTRPFFSESAPIEYGP